MVFKNEKQLEAFLMNKCRLALMKAQDKVYSIIQNFVRQFYSEYSPELYERTYQLLRSLVQSRIVSDGKGYKAEIYFNIDGLKYNTGANPSGEQVMAAASQGAHGAIGQANGVDLKYISSGAGTGVWDDPIMYLDAEAINILKSMLIAEGIPIK